MSKELICWKCGGPLAALSLPLRRLDECPACETELHVCKMCEFFDPHVAKSCREPIADEVKDKERANFCDYFTPKPNAYNPAEKTASQAALSELEALFGKPDSSQTNPADDADEAVRRAEELFAKSGKNKTSPE